MLKPAHKMRLLQLPGRETVRTTQSHLLLLALLPEIDVEEAQEDVQGADEGSRRVKQSCGFCMRACSSSTGAYRSLELETDPPQV